MKERYPFFRDETEHSLAVIGESAVEPDLNGQFEKPYAVLTSKWLYVKNERGNFMVPTDQVQRAGQGVVPAMVTLIRAIFALAALYTFFAVFCYSSVLREEAGPLPALLCIFAICGGLSLYFVKERAKLSAILLAVYSFLFYLWLFWPYICIFVSWKLFGRI